MRAAPAVIGILLAGCAGRGSADSPDGLPACPEPVTEAFDPVWEDELRFDASTAVWESEPEAVSADGVETWTGQGTASTELQLNRGYTYAALGTLTADVDTTVALVETTESDALVAVASWTVPAGGSLAIAEDIPIDANARTFHVTVDLSAPGTASLGLTFTGQQWADEPDAHAAAPVELGFMMHIEDTGALTTDETNWLRRAAVVEALSSVLHAHGASLTLQPGESFIAGEEIFAPGWFQDREAEGMTWSVHVHNESDGSEALEKAVRNGIQNYAAAGVTVKDLNGGFRLALWDEFAKAGLESLTAFKNPDTQLDLARPHVQPWRPADGTGADDEDAFGTQDPDGPLVYLPGSGVREADHARFGNFAARHLAQVRAHARAGYVNTWYFMEHVDGFGPDAATDAFEAYQADGLGADMALIDQALTEVIDPLVAAGEVVYSNPETMRADWLDWESRCAQ